MVANTYHWISLVRHAGHRVLAHPARLPQTGHLIVISTSRFRTEKWSLGIAAEFTTSPAGAHFVAGAVTGAARLILTFVQSGQWSESFT